jgi:Cyclin, N-terminal domain
MDSQKDLAWKMRGILTGWLIQVHTRFRLLSETLYLAVNIIDRFLSARVVSLAKLKLAAASMWLARFVDDEVQSDEDQEDDDKDDDDDRDDDEILDEEGFGEL